ncbi:hypothetical protein K469DRAFT_700385 [Zopfia rhizophila CBS 207.26]|uniref:Uncharacterized protein n=1 Tax=Zopfia rhizophila CBS 207.26 TaxID=1314779 RepID=A0A6A6DAR9_9PEZI|nr:hypothetical protein K469DRAFT_700385 [Zopfia rhizophila CBS 207.26]
MNGDKTDYTLASESLILSSTSLANEAMQSQDESGEKTWSRRSPWLQSMAHRTARVLRATPPYIRTHVVPLLRNAKPTKKQCVALLLLVLLSIFPFSILYDRVGFAAIFRDKTLSCGDGFGNPENATVSGIEGLFTLDLTFGKLTFSQAKLIDVAWDLFIGRGAQMLAWYISYIVFSDALLRLIERHPASFRTFAYITLEGPSLGSTWALVLDLFRSRSKQTWSLFAYLLVSSLYILAIPTILGAMTGYVNTSIAWVSLNDTLQQIIPVSDFEETLYVYKVGNVTMNNPCIKQNSTELYNLRVLASHRNSECYCTMSNGSDVSYYTWQYHTPYEAFPPPNCTFPDTQIFTSDWDTDVHNCSENLDITIDGQPYAAEALYSERGYCYQGKGYNHSYLVNRTSCLPDIAHPSFEWGFSTMLSGVFIIVQFFWGLSMYAVWQDAQFNSKLVKSGYSMSQLRAAFAVTTAAKAKTDLEDSELLREDVKGLARGLFGTMKERGAEVECEIYEGVLKEGLIERRQYRSMEDLPRYSPATE